MSQELSECAVDESQSTEAAFPFPFNQHTFCRYEPIAQTIEAARVLIVDNLLRDEGDLSEVGLAEWGDAAATQLRRERVIAEMALENISNNIARLVKRPTTEVAHLADVAEAAHSEILISTSQKLLRASAGSFGSPRFQYWQFAVAIRLWA
jgi:hypothetical protein